MKKETLIEQANNILSLIHVEDLFHIGSLEECVDERYIPMVKQWVNDLHVYASKIDSKLGEMLLNQWYFNGRRVSSQRIKQAIAILEQI